MTSARTLPPTRAFDSVQVGDALPPLEIAVTTTLVVATAIASRDYQDVHHDRSAAQGGGADDIFMNILTTNGFVGRYVTDWAGPNALLRGISIRLGVPNCAGDTVLITGTVTGKDDSGDAGIVTIDVKGINSLGNHVTGFVRVALPREA